MSIFDSYNFDWTSSSGTPIGSAIGDYISGNSRDGYSILGDAINGYITSGDSASGLGSTIGNANWGSILNTLGRLGAGIGGFMSGRDISKQKDYIPYTRWLGNGLAQTGYINNTANKENKLNRAYDLSNLFAGALNKYKLSNNNNSSSDFIIGGDIYNPGDLYGNNTYGPIGNAINTYMKV